MKRPPKLRELRVDGGNSSLNPPSSFNSLLSRVSIFQSGDSSASHGWDVGDQIPGFKIPYAFLSSLRANLQISSSTEDLYLPSPSITNTPANQFITHSSSSLSLPNGAWVTPSPQPLLSSSPERPIKDDIKQISPPAPLTTASARTDDEIATALRLIGDGVAQQRQIAVRCIISHPVVLAISLMVFLTIAKLLYTGSPSDYVLMVTLWTVCSLVGLVTVRYLVGEYLDIAERVGSWAWLSESSVNGVSQRRDEVLITRSGDEIVGVCVLRIAKTVPSAGTPGARVAGVRSSRRKSSARWTGIIRAWTVERSHRGQGIGANLLKEVISYCRLRALEGPMFADDHAHSDKVLPPIFNVKFDEHEKWTKNYLERLIIEQRGR